jgi:hypothetical protein
MTPEERRKLLNLRPVDLYVRVMDVLQDVLADIECRTVKGASYISPDAVEQLVRMHDGLALIVEAHTTVDEEAA